MFRTVLAAALCAVLMTPAAEARRHRFYDAGIGRPTGCPSRWCGCYLMKRFGLSDRRLWRAREWARQGRDAGGPGIDVVVVWPHHVGVITGRADNGAWIVHSGNDGRRVRERPRSLARAIAFRRV